MLIDGRVRAGLAATTRFGDVRLLEVTDSTNRVVAAEAAAGVPEGLVVVADRQTAGRGRLDRRWETEAGVALLVSVLLRPQALQPARWHLLTAAAGLAARRACREVAGVVPDLKWPNDLMVGEGKLAGILAEAAGGSVVVGMGLNVHGAPAGAAWLDQAAGRRIGRTDLLVAWLESLDGLLGRWDEVADRYGEECATVGRHVVVHQGASELVGRAEGVDAAGRLLVRPETGGPGEAGVVAVAAGDVTHLRPAGGTW